MGRRVVIGGVKVEHWETDPKQGVIEETPLQETYRKPNTEPKYWINRVGRICWNALKTDLIHGRVHLVTKRSLSLETWM